jgi:DNA-binding NtrC family response regulator
MSVTDEEAAKLTRILLVDDDQLVGHLCSRILMTAGFEVCYSHSSLQALEIVSKRSFNVIILDFDMPILNGEQLGAELKVRGTRAAMIMYSGRLTPTSECDRIFHSFVSKGEGVEALISAVRAAAQLQLASRSTSF